MKNDLSNYRKSYEKGALLKRDAPEDPMELFEQWFREVDQSDHIDEANAMTLATKGVDGFPKNRVVLLKEFNDDGFIFYTNYNSDKGRAIAADAHVCLSFFWHAAERQVIIKGLAEKVSEERSDAYFQSRPRGSQLSAVVSDQSSEVEDRNQLEEKLQSLEETLKGKPVPRPKDWGGYCVAPVEIEFWQGRANRLHDRLRYTLDENQRWHRARLAP